MKIEFNLSEKDVQNNKDLIETVLKDRFVVIDTITDITIDYTFKFEDFSQTAKRVAIVKALAEVAKIGNIQDIEELREAFYYLDCMKEDLSSILKLLEKE